MIDTLDRLVTILKQERSAYQSTADMATSVGVPYDALYALLNGNRVRGINIDMLATLARHFPAVAAIFLSSNSQIRKIEAADSQEVEATA